MLRADIEKLRTELLADVTSSYDMDVVSIMRRVELRFIVSKLDKILEKYP